MSLYTLIGAMSGTSMDGVDIVCTQFETAENKPIKYTCNCFKTYPYSSKILDSLMESTKLNAPELLQLDKRLGRYFAQCITEFIEEHKLDVSEIDAIASHGHTVYHQPENGFTCQIGCGDTIAYYTGIKVINDFRQKDVIAGGTGAPLVPLGDQLLYGHIADAFLNIGGFCNISVLGDTTIAYDICPGNLPLNYLMGRLGKSYDANGESARKGQLDAALLEALNNLPYYDEQYPKSLGTEWLEIEFTPLINASKNTYNTLNTVVEHIATQISKACMAHEVNHLYITGGGAYNSYLVQKIEKKTNVKIILPTPAEIEFKEAIIFSFLGLRYLEKRHNTLPDVTGAKHGVIGGVLHLP
ncbi:anhydro-N-acetylmuramic acid kinase [Crocinitomicaceae bacterium]|nr:anhydro-N-acetylmuramic acid kinase [Crocinitomicaceae bacterium]MDG1036486.1 anhydro-N-acetylmuramic acid kinase [Crocinitomicaceae bacterium]